MSRSNNTELTNPAVRFFDWHGQDGTIAYYDKETKENVPVKLPFKFLILDKVAQVTGGIDEGNGYEGFWSNAVRNTTTQAFVVRSKRGIETQGFWQQIKGHPGVKFMTGLYIAFPLTKDEFAIGYLKIKGAALSAWIEFVKGKNTEKGAITITGNAKKKKGATTYYEPVFEYQPDVPEKVEQIAIELDVELQDYLTQYFGRHAIEEVEREYVPTNGEKAMVANHTGAFYNNAPEMPPSSDDAPTTMDELDDIPF
jgi:hypothetical protein